MPDRLFFIFVKQMISEIMKGNLSAVSTLRYYTRWRRSLLPAASSIADKQPWITFPVIDLLLQYVTKNTRVFEFGGGGSTLFFTGRAKEVVTVEHDPEWFEKLQQMIGEGNFPGWTGKLILPEKTDAANTRDPSNPADYYTADTNFSAYTFKNYVSLIDNYPPEYVDIVLVDGRSRPSCIMHSIPRIKKGGLLVIDNSDRDYYFNHLGSKLKKEFEVIYNKKAPSPYVNFFTQTGIWKKL